MATNDENNISWGDELNAFIEKSESLKVPYQKSPEEAWNSFTHRLDTLNNNDDYKDDEVMHPSMPGLRIAAAILVLFAIGWWAISNLQTTTISTKPGEITTIQFPDGSIAILNAGSQISYSKHKWHSNRELSLQGEAFFSVEKGTEFLVKFNSGSVMVLGTEFSVYSRNLRTRVKVSSGKVKVALNHHEKIPLTKGQGIDVDEKTTKIKIIKTSPEAVKGWTQGKFYFESEDLNVVFDEIERQFKVTIETQNIENRKYTGFFNDNNLELALKNVCEPMSLNYTISKNTVKIW